MTQELFDRTAAPPLAHRLVMVRPVGFGFNPETAATNHFAKSVSVAKSGSAVSGAAVDPSAALAMREFEGVVAGLRKRGITVLELEPRPTPPTPDAVFPNNWFSTHAPTKKLPNGCVVLYPMQAHSRRGERRALFVEAILQAQAKAHGTERPTLIDLSPLESQGHFLEGTGSLILDHARAVAYVGYSSRTSPEAVSAWVDAMQVHGPWRCVDFNMEDRSERASERTTAGPREIYHTNLVLSLGQTTALWVEDAIPDPTQRAAIRRELEASGRTVVTLSFAQMHASCANALLVSTADSAYWAISQGAWLALHSSQREVLARDGQWAPFAIPTIESIGGGSVRCMLGELL